MASCCVADQFCTDAANFEGANARAVCFVCGLPVCLMCSTRRQYKHYGRVRLCNECQIEYDGNDKRVMARLYRLAARQG